mmetsp:Transcript_25977/g.22909  ORF Transcript_25977/g.22909 Transcript_25977/m.22909 type:complete len:86 (+) Transcript_25977:729-986(+)
MPKYIVSSIVDDFTSNYNLTCSKDNSFLYTCTLKDLYGLPYIGLGENLKINPDSYFTIQDPKCNSNCNFTLNIAGYLTTGTDTDF